VGGAGAAGALGAGAVVVGFIDGVDDADVAMMFAAAVLASVVAAAEGDGAGVVVAMVINKPNYRWRDRKKHMIVKTILSYLNFQKLIRLLLFVVWNLCHRQYR
jgi:hypothetical protein